MEEPFNCQPCQRDSGEWIVLIEVPMEDEPDARAWSHEFMESGALMFTEIEFLPEQ